jgi:hypothetical protein
MGLASVSVFTICSPNGLLGATQAAYKRASLPSTLYWKQRYRMAETIHPYLTGWAPNPNVYATATKLSGPWTSFRPIAPASPNTYGAQSTFLLKVTGTKKTTVIFMGDIWKPKALWDSRYLWMPLDMKSGGMLLPPPHPWTINTKTGVAHLANK